MSTQLLLHMDRTTCGCCVPTIWIIEQVRQADVTIQDGTYDECCHTIVQEIICVELV